MRSVLARFFSEAALLALTISLGLCIAIKATPPPDLTRAQPRAQLVTSKSGDILWGFLAQDDKWRLSTTSAEVDPRFLGALISFEDKRFWRHRGVDLLAMGRAVMDALWCGRVVSGGSTLTMQVVRMLEPKPRTLAAKLDEMRKALALERLLDKDKILNLYLTLAPFGGNIESVRSASLLYFGKEPKHLSFSEAALLVALPQSPEVRRPDRFPAAARAARDRVLSSLARRQVITTVDAVRAMREPVPTRLHSFRLSAPHLAIRLRAAAANRVEPITSLIDTRLQRQVEGVATRAIAHWDNAVNIAVIVLRNHDASVAAYLGGVDLTSESRKGFIDLVQAIRSPGSTLKPFIYALAFEKLIVHPDTIIRDHPVEIEGYSPENADGQFYGDMSVRRALILSRNTPVVRLLHEVGVGAFLSRFRSSGRPLRLPGSDSAAGLAVGLGGVGVRLEQLVWFFTTFANEGKLNALRLRPSDPAQLLGQFISPAAARATADILADVPPPHGYARQRAGDGGRRIGFKTGTSYGFRDAWAVGFDRKHTVGVWVGRPDGAAHLGAYGATAAAPILMHVFDRISAPLHGIGTTVAGALTSFRNLPDRLARFRESGDTRLSSALRILFPPDGSSIRLDKPRVGQAELTLAAVGGRPRYQWRLEGKPQPWRHSPAGRFVVDGRGQFEVSIVDANGAIARASFWIE